MTRAPRGASATQAAIASLDEWRRTHQLPCACSPIEVRAEREGDECASCGRRVVVVSDHDHREAAE